LNVAVIAQEKVDIITRENLAAQINIAFNDLELLDSDNKAFKIIAFVEKNKINLKNKRSKGLIKYFKGHIAINQSQFDLSENYTVEALSLFTTINDKKLIALCYNNLSYIKSRENKFKKVKEYSSKAVDILEACNGKKYLIDIYFNLTKRDTIQKKSLESIKNGKRAIHLIDSLGIKKTRLKYLYNIIAYNQIMLGKYSEAEINLQQALRLSNKGYIILARIYRDFGLLYDKTGKHQLAIKYYDLAFKNYNLSTKHRKKNLNKKANREYELQQDLDLSKEQGLRNHKLLIYLSVAFLILSLLVIFRFYELSKRLRENLKKIKGLNNEMHNANLSLKEKKEKIELLLNLNERTLFSKVLKISTYNDSIKKIGNTITKLIEADSEIKKNQLLHIEKSLRSIISEDELWQDFKIQFEKTHPQFFIKLTNICSDLSVNDLKHCSYIISKLSNKDVANLISISPRSVETARYRIKKKIGLNKENNLFEFLQNL